MSVTSNTYFLVKPNDNGFGFGLGSTDGVINTYGYRGFARPALPEYSQKMRDNMNMRACMGSYACHFDPYPPCGSEENKQKNKRCENISDFPDTKKGKWWLILIFIVATCFYYYNR